MKVLFVCTGNICRSPLGQQMLQQMLSANSLAQEITVASAGTQAMDGYPMDRGSIAAISNLGFVPQTHVAQQLTAQLVSESDLVLTFTEDQRTDVVELHVRANRYTFTLLEFANQASFQLQKRVVGAGSNLSDLLGATIAMRGMAPFLTTYDIADPYGKDATSFERMALQTQNALKQVIEWLP